MAIGVVVARGDLIAIGELVGSRFFSGSFKRVFLQAIGALALVVRIVVGVQATLQ